MGIYEQVGGTGDKSGRAEMSLDHGDHVTDYSQITDNIFIGSDLCMGLYCPMHSAEFKRLGISAEINLEIERNEQPTVGVEIYLWLPIEDNACPTMDQLMVGTVLIDQISKSMKKVYVHCRNGHGRSPTVVVAYLVRFRHMSVAEAIEFMKKKRPEIHPNAAQIEGLLAFEKLWK